MSMRALKFICLVAIAAAISSFSFIFISIFVLNINSVDVSQLNQVDLRSNIPRPFIVESGSMEPTIKAGSIVFVVRSNHYKPNDIISFAPDGEGHDVVTHRISYKQISNVANAEEVYITKGDENEEADKKTVRMSQIVGKVRFTLPYFGRIAIFAKSPYGFILLFIIPATIVVYEELKFLGFEIKKISGKLVGRFRNGRERHLITSSPHKGFQKIVVIIPLVAAGLIFTSVTKSFFSDTERSVQNTFSAGIFSTPTPSVSPTPVPTGEIFTDQEANKSGT